ncbi:MAG TPA: cytochrome P450 [Thermomicrobiales bacterium]|nr:cytochrome P450 [Thermomicrobiales bacterium]
MGSPPSVPRLGPINLLQNLKDYTVDPIGFLTRVARESDEATRIIAGPMNVFFISKPEHVEDVLVTRAFNFTPVSVPALRQAGPESLVNSRGELSLRMRDVLHTAYGHDHLVTHADMMTDSADELRQRWADGATLEIEREMLSLTVRMTNRMLFGSVDPLTPREVDAAVSAADFLSSQTTHPVISVIAALPVRPPTRQYQRDLSVLSDAVSARIQARRSVNWTSSDMATAMLRPNGGDASQSLTDRELRDEIVSLLTAGNINVPAALTWTWYLLSQHPDIDAAFHAEIDSVLGDRPATMDDVIRLPLTRAIVSEALRLFPPAWVIGRNVLHDFALDNVLLRAGSMIAISPYVMHRNPRYFQDPDQFDPSRWDPERAHELRPFTYMPFSGGPRGCMGAGFADIALMLLLPTLARGWTMRLDPGYSVALLPGITLRPRNGMPMSLHRRESPSAG